AVSEYFHPGGPASRIATELNQPAFSGSAIGDEGGVICARGIEDNRFPTESAAHQTGVVRESRVSSRAVTIDIRITSGGLTNRSTRVGNDGIRHRRGVAKANLSGICTFYRSSIVGKRGLLSRAGVNEDHGTGLPVTVIISDAAGISHEGCAT